MAGLPECCIPLRHASVWRNQSGPRRSLHPTMISMEQRVGDVWSILIGSSTRASVRHSPGSSISLQHTFSVCQELSRHGLVPDLSRFSEELLFLWEGAAHWEVCPTQDHILHYVEPGRPDQFFFAVTVLLPLQDSWRRDEKGGLVPIGPDPGFSSDG